ncbi:serpin B7 [Erinaceus europaeus]|uniref:Serpin B7 n=1 Tax=Erinaceus europaeus TaxID=9365 RepID=A0A1S2ZSP9_ERIEU|nr:serpin B7 [Erinaceus europaeus]XP_060029976.1 serpin B7 [Erinaceus europaeus]XP_060029977.1 serpin B7 [Erinaceus europaeus]XP_060029978.1 serpin B7 [Erinaceus europaeus]XP_060029979.1 serpin B7 [Erinaceus europaeus]XP_060029980.1 serpin B7 [Erinaceus europaeus]XP_060029981.1 serpin B7 [Erinaceus europaeus]XP_060029983.1 serpin B7 [Erinaceus europaeus]XP_060029984.1 serpin B7 [Erinaceus europaeus]XP_060029985.1 serpin B7 [Erinaceus europaeus]
MASLAVANAEFCFNLFQEMDNNQGTGNVFFSSLSIFTALALVRLGARGDCAAQIDKILHFNAISGPGSPSNSQTELQSQLKSVLSDINISRKDYDLSISNGLFAEKVFDIRKDFIRCAEKLYNAKVEHVDFTNDVEDTRYKINKWINYETHGKIKNIFHEGSISSSAVMVLANAVYFKGKWESAFTKSKTLNCRFRSPKCPGKPVSMMHQERRFNMSVIREPPMQVLELRYLGGISMYIMLPENDLSQIENKLSFQNLMDWTNPKKMKSQYVEVFLPPFKIEKNYEVKNSLRALGLKDIFDESRADLSGIAAGGRLYISKLMHKSYIEVSEEGTEAAAATGSNIVEKQLPESMVFRADHPFLFVIRKDDIILFSGKVSCP